MTSQNSFTSTTGTNVGKSVGAGSIVTFNAINLTEAASSAQLIIRANDVDYGLKNSANVEYAVGNKNSEWDGVYIQKAGSTSWTFVGYLNGTNNNWSYTTFDISSFVSGGGMGGYTVRIVPDDDGTQKQKSNGGTWVVTVPSAEIFLGGSGAISALAETGQSVTSTWSADLVGSYTIQYLLTDATGRAVAQVNASVNETVAGASQTSTAQLTPNSNFYSSWAALPSGKYTLQATLVDAAGVVRGIKSTETVIDATAPTVAIASDTTSLKAGEFATLSLTFSEAPLGLALDDLSSSSGILSNLVATADPKVYQVKLTPSTNFTGDITVGVRAGGYTDASGNAGESGSLTGLHVDTAAPTVQISASTLALTSGHLSTLTFTFSDAPTGFTAADIVASHGTLRDFRATTNPLVYTAVFAPEKAYTGNAGVSIANGAYTDASGNAGQGAALSNIVVAKHVLSKLDFENTRTWGYTELLTPGGGVWQTDNLANMVEVGNEGVYGSRSPLNNHVIELAARPGDPSNLYTQFDAAAGTQLVLSFDYSARKNAPSSVFEVVWDGAVVAAIDPGKAFAWKHADYTLDVGTTGQHTVELRAVNKNSYGGVLDNVTLSATQISAPDASTATTLGVQDFQGESVSSGTSKNIAMASAKGWFSDNPLGKVEIGSETVFGGKNAANKVIELANNTGNANNLYTHLLFEQGTHIQFNFDISARQGKDSRVNVLLDGKVIDSINAGTNFGWQNHSVDVVANGEMQRLELQAVTNNNFGAVLDNLTLATHAVV